MNNDDNISRIEAALEQVAINDDAMLFVSVRNLRALLDRLKAAEAERDTFYMDYRMKCDEETKRQEVEIERLREALERLARLGNGRLYGNSEGNMIARAALENTNAAMRKEGGE